ncbi:hypothetical protein JTB14_036557 [Gonioctena quinquepunctata]|nr:hypothetical protein JTB14_036557 [Gonioctena quinquepunctata]
MRACKRSLNIQAECRKLLNNIPEKASENLKTRIFSFFNDDEVSNVITYDEAIITYEEKTILSKTEHIAEFRIYLEGRIRYFINKLERCYCHKSLGALGRVYIGTFNCIQPRETQPILVDDYKSYEILNEDDVSGDTDALSKEQIKKWARILLTGKLGQNTV